MCLVDYFLFETMLLGEKCNTVAKPVYFPLNVSKMHLCVEQQSSACGLQPVKQIWIIDYSLKKQNIKKTQQFIHLANRDVKDWLGHIHHFLPLNKTGPQFGHILINQRLKKNKLSAALASLHGILIWFSLITSQIIKHDVQQDILLQIHLHPSETHPCRVQNQAWIS